jgi:hypothetical protein
MQARGALRVRYSIGGPFQVQLDMKADYRRSVDHWFRHWMPYYFQRIAHPNYTQVFLPLNRGYKPLGITSSESVDYHAFISQAVRFSSDPAAFPDVWAGQPLYLYSDAPPSLVDYFQRLDRLSRRQMRLVGIQDAEMDQR